MKMVILDGYTANPGDLSWAELEGLGELTVYERTSPNQVAAHIGEAAVVLTNKSLITAETLAACPGIRYIGVLATGYNVVDVEAAAARGIPVTNIPAYSTDSVAQYVFALLLEICSRVGEHSAAVHQGQWQRSPDFCFWNHPLIELAGKTMGIIGFGRIGRQTGSLARAFGMQVIAHSTSENEEGRAIGSYVSLEELLAKSDVISLHAPLSPATQGLINTETIGKMKDGAILINTARGPLVDEAALAAALNSGKLYAAGVDVVSSEPIKADNPLLAAKNCVITPHIAWAPIEARTRLLKIAAGNVRAFLQGSPVNVVNGPV